MAKKKYEMLNKIKEETPEKIGYTGYDPLQMKERITDNNGKDINFQRPNGDKLKDPFFVKTVSKI